LNYLDIIPHSKGKINSYYENISKKYLVLVLSLKL